MELTFGELRETPIGPVSFAAGDLGLRRIAFMHLDELKNSEFRADIQPSLKGLETISSLISEVNEYLFGLRRVFTVGIDWGSIVGFQREVLTLTAQIPFGSTMTYGEIASKIGKPGAARAVGKALGENPIPIVIPCHRVIGSDGGLRGYIGGVPAKVILLKLEGHRIENSQVVSQESWKKK